MNHPPLSLFSQSLPCLSEPTRSWSCRSIIPTSCPTATRLDQTVITAPLTGTTASLRQPSPTPPKESCHENIPRALRDGLISLLLQRRSWLAWMKPEVGLLCLPKPTTTESRSPRLCPSRASSLPLYYFPTSANAPSGDHHSLALELAPSFPPLTFFSCSSLPLEHSLPTCLYQLKFPKVQFNHCLNNQVFQVPPI